MDVREFIQRRHNPSDLIELCKTIRVDKSSERLNVSKQLGIVNQMIEEEWQPGWL